MWSVPLRVSCPGPVLRLACLGGGGLVPVPPYLAWGCGGGGWASPGGSIAWGVGRSSSPICPSTRWAVGVCVAGVRLWGPRSALVGGGERCRLGVQAPARRVLMTSLMRTELRPAGCVGGLG